MMIAAAESPVGWLPNARKTRASPPERAALRAPAQSGTVRQSFMPASDVGGASIFDRGFHGSRGYPWGPSRGALPRRGWRRDVRLRPGYGLFHEQTNP